MAPPSDIDDLLRPRPGRSANGERVTRKRKIDGVLEGPGPKPGPVAKRALSGPEFLNSLADSEAKGLYDLMRKTARRPPTSVVNVSAPVAERLHAVKAKQGTDRDGKWWLALVTCEVWESTDGGHPRWQVDVNAGPAGLVEQIREVLSVESFDRFLRCRTARGESGKVMVKLQRHHVALNADLVKRAAGPVIPLNAGKGGSVSHLCDKTGCARACHLETASLHRDNVDRQRCPGPLLMLFRDEIVEEKPCRHGEQVSSTPVEQFHHSCLGCLQVLELSEDAASVISRLKTGLSL